MAYELRAHPADVAVEATGSTLDAAFAAAADGLAACHLEGEVPDSGDRFDVALEAPDRERLLFDYLDQLIYERDVRNVLPVANEVTIEATVDGFTLTGSARGVPLESVRAREVKAVTYSEMMIDRHDDGWRVYVVFDV